MFSDYDWTAGDDWNFLDSVLMDDQVGDSYMPMDYSYQNWMGDIDTGGEDAGSSWWSKIFGGGDGDDSGNFWGSALNAAGAYALNEAQQKNAEDLMKRKLKDELALMAEKEKYYQLHGQQLADAYKQYEQYNTPPVNPFGLLAQGGGFGTGGGFGG